MKLQAAMTAVCLILGFVLSTLPGAHAKDVSKIPPIKKRFAMIFKPHIQYPAEAKRAGMGGSGIMILAVDPETGKVTAAWMAKSTGHAILDREAIRAFRQARFTKGTPSRITVPVRFNPRF